MEVIESIFKTTENLQKIRKQGHGVGFVPTMGALHDGHISLINSSIEKNDFTVCSIFVNPTQFDNPSDLIKYPKTIEEDILLLKRAGCDFLFLPSVKEMYPNGAESKQYNFGGIENEMEGKHRAGHFDGVGTIVSKLLEVVQPDNAYFGEKDYQQLLIVKKLVELLQLPTQIIGCPIKREPNGLAMSSRNKRLSQDQFDASSFIYKQLLLAQNLLRTNSIQEINQIITTNFSENPYFELEYFSVADSQTLKEVERLENNQKVRAFVAAFAEEVRLIDNIALN